MKKTNLSFLKFLTTYIKGMFGLVALTMALNANGQCSLACNGTTNVSLDDQNCEALISYGMVADTSGCLLGDFSVEIVDDHGNVVPDATVTADHVGMTLEVSVIDNDSQNSCWGYLVVEDKLRPSIDCGAPSTLYCYELDTYAPVATDNCDSNPEVIVTDEVVVVNDCNSNFPENVIKRVTRTYIAIDDQGLESDECELTFDIIRIDELEDIDEPDNYLLLDDTALDCDANFPLDENGHPSPLGPNGTGVPSLDGVDLFPNVYEECNILVTYADTELPPIGCAIKIMRTWSIIEWSCSNPQRSYEFIQMIEIVDDEGPEIVCPPNRTASTNLESCEASFLFDPASVNDACSDEVTVDITYPGGFLNNQNGGLGLLPVGENVVTYTAYDECHNSNSCEITVTVSDHTPPVAICDQNTTVAVTTDGTAKVPASVFDDGSYDECALRCQVVKRMNPDPCDCHVPSFNGYDYLGSFEGKYYYLSQWPYTYGHAKKEAAALEGTLAVLNTVTEFNWVHDRVQAEFDTDPYYVGLERNNQGNFEWVDGTPLTYNNWNPGEPNNVGGNENVLEIMPDGGWNDVPESEEMRFVIEISDVCGFSDFANFCCADIGDEELMVVYRVIDASGNYNDCMVNVEVQDKLPPAISCPADMTVNCDFIYDDEDLAASFGNATVIDNCDEVSPAEVPEFDLNQCNIGSITRTFTVADGGGSATCFQVVTFEPIDPFNDGVEDYEPDTDIIWPLDVTIEGCADLDPSNPDIQPEVTGFPTFIEGACDLVGANYEDQVFPFNNSNGDACFKIVRHWTVIDWCQFVNDGTSTYYPEWTWTQIIKINDFEAPVIDPIAERVSNCTYDATCSNGFIELVASASDNCTNSLSWTYQIDAFNDGSFDSGLSNSGFGSTIDASGNYPVGNHRILYTFLDRCGNVTSVEQLFDIVNCKAPTPYCLNGLAVDLMPIDEDNDGEVDFGMVELWASDFDAGSFHPCGYEVYLSFEPVVYSENGNVTLPNGDRIQVVGNRTFTCADIGEAPVSIYAAVVTPMDTIIQAFCSTFVDVQDNMEACSNDDDDDGMRADLDGGIVSINDQNVENAEVHLNGADMPYAMTSIEGMYAFPSMPLGGTYEIVPKKNDDYLNGVSTLDLVMIQRHILGLEDITDPYLMIAADVNNDGSISASDLLSLRKLILGIYAELPNVGSWRFIDEAFVFPDSENPFATNFPETYYIEALNGDMTVDFVGVKVGDVSNDAAANVNDTDLSTRSGQTVTLNMTNATVTAGTITEIPVVMTEDIDVSGFQIAFEIENASSVINDITSDFINIDASNISVLDNEVRVSWNTTDKVALYDGDVLFTLEITANTNAPVSKLVSVSEEMNAEMYNDQLSVYNIDLAIDTRNADEYAYELYQNVPNPFVSNTVIGVQMPKSDVAVLTIMDVSGRILSTNTHNLNKGYNELIIDNSNLNASGVLYYQLKSGDFIATKKMIIIE